jgi:hypothetical protein
MFNKIKNQNEFHYLIVQLVILIKLSFYSNFLSNIFFFQFKSSNEWSQKSAAVIRRNRHCNLFLSKNLKFHFFRGCEMGGLSAQTFVPQKHQHFGFLNELK